MVFSGIGTSASSGMIDNIIIIIMTYYNYIYVHTTYYILVDINNYPYLNPLNVLSDKQE